MWFIHPELEGYKLRHDTSREQLNEELGRLSYKMIVKLLDILGLQNLFERWEKIPLGVMYKTSSENRTFRCKLLREPQSNCTLQTGVYGAYWDNRNFSKFNFFINCERLLLMWQYAEVYIGVWYNNGWWNNLQGKKIQGGNFMSKSLRRLLSREVT